MRRTRRGPIDIDSEKIFRVAARNILREERSGRVLRDLGWCAPCIFRPVCMTP
jgi:hypothetical protein